MIEIALACGSAFVVGCGLAVIAVRLGLFL